MHDAKGRELKVGDKVVVLATITQLSATEEYCNVDLTTDYGRRPDLARERISAINTGVLLRANPGDEGDDLFGDLPADESVGIPVTIGS